MTNPKFVAQKNYQKSPFILTDRKLSRLVEVAKERFEKMVDVDTFIEQYEVRFKDGKVLIIDTLENLLRLDNSQKNPVIDIQMHFEIKSKGDSQDKHRVDIFFEGDRYYTVGVQGESEDLSWLQETVGGIEEQLERTIPRDWPYAINSASPPFFAALMAALLGVTLALSTAGTVSQKGLLNISDSRKEELATLSSNSKSEGEKIDFLFRYISATLETNNSPTKAQLLLKNPRTYFIGIPILIALISAIAAIFFFYPRRVFAWGDCGEAYEKTIERRKFLWYGVLFALIIGIIGNLFVVGITS